LSTPYHSQYWAHALTLAGAGGSLDSLGRSVAGARVDLNPHQIDAALFAVRSPLSKGVILADEVGLGKTIEAGLVIAQRWAERKRRVLLVLPATLRKQWQQELEEKFALPSVILEGKSFNEARRGGKTNPFDVPDRLVLCSYHFAAAKSHEVRALSWDLVVMDEAHRLRNVYKSGNKMAAALAAATAHAPKLLLTATPLQNSLMELFGLVSILDPHVFGDAASFREQFLRGEQNERARNRDLKARLLPLCRRTLRKQVLEYIRFTQRIPLTQDFLPTDEEQALYEAVSAYLQREVLLALPASQRTLMTLVLRKLLASSTYAIAGTLRRLVTRLEQLELSRRPALPLDEDDFDALDELQEEWGEEPEAEGVERPAAASAATDLRQELEELRRFAALAESIQFNAKGEALLSVLGTALERATDLGAARKAVIFTESVRTQRYLYDLLSRNGYGGRIVLINGSNADPDSRAIYEEWTGRHRRDGAASGSRSADMKAALVEAFRDRATLLIATESAAEGVNLQFCSLVVNFDLPWNPQRVEQRIGRCHRYGQKHDVVVVNFLNRRNAADQRVFELLAEKFKLFDGVFGASDEVLGALESGVDLEKRIAQVYQECRTEGEIQTAFDALQAELEESIRAQMSDTRRSLLENFDEEVHERLKVHREQALVTLSQRQRWLLELTRHELGPDAQWDEKEPRFRYSGTLAPHGHYHFDWKQAEARNEPFYRLEHPLAQRLLAQALGRRLGPAHLTFRYQGHGAIISALEPLAGQSGWLRLAKLSVDSLQHEEFLLLSACTDGGDLLDDDHCQKLLSLSARVESAAPLPTAPPEDLLEAAQTERLQAFLAEVEARNGGYFDEEQEKLDRWADDLKFGVEREIKELDREIREARKRASGVVALADKLQAQREMKALEAKRNQKRRDLYEAQDAIDHERDALIANIERQLKHKRTVEPTFTVRWTVA